MTKKSKSAARTSLEIEWKRLAKLVPQVIADPRIVEDIEKDIFNLIDGKSTCEEIIKAQESYSRDGATLILLKLEKDGIISCLEPLERLRDVKFERCEAEKEQEFTLLEKRRLEQHIAQKRNDIQQLITQQKKLQEEIKESKEKIKRNTVSRNKLSSHYADATNSVDQLISKKMDMLRRKKNIDETITMIEEETVYLKDEKYAAMRCIRELESKIDEVLHIRESVIPKMSIYRSVVREAYKTLRDAQNRAEHTLKGVE